MNAYETFATGWASAIDVLAGAVGKSVLEMCRDGLDTAMAKRVEQLAGVYFGSTNATRKQAAVRGYAVEARHTMNTLAEIEAWVRKLDKKKDAWALRGELCQAPPVMRTIRERAKKLLEQFNEPKEMKNKASVSARALPDSTYMRFSADAPGHLVQAAMDALDGLTATDGSKASNEQQAVAAIQRIIGGVTGEGDAADAPGAGPELHTRVIVHADDLAAIEAGDGDEIVLSLTNGCRMTGKDYCAAKLSEYCRIVLVAPMFGPLNVYEGRFANEKQREAAAAVDPCCVIDGCGVGADYSQVNHNVAYGQGGSTSIDNLSTMCDFHNGRLTDGRNQEKFGSVEQMQGQNYYVPPFGGKPRLNEHPTAQGGAMRRYPPPDF